MPGRDIGSGDLAGRLAEMSVRVADAEFLSAAGVDPGPLAPVGVDMCRLVKAIRAVEAVRDLDAGAAELRQLFLFDSDSEAP